MTGDMMDGVARALGCVATVLVVATVILTLLISSCVRSCRYRVVKVETHEKR